jgi:uracil-DNA glycosylase
MFVGEAPGEFEDALGVPFIGRAGAILDQTIKRVPHQFEYLITNVVCCRPQTVIMMDTEADDILDKDSVDLADYQRRLDYEIIDYNREPTPEEVKACKGHLDELYTDFSPHGIVHLGAVARQYFTPKCPSLSLLHPAYIVRKEYKLLLVLKQARKLELFVEKLCTR